MAAGPRQTSSPERGSAAWEKLYSSFSMPRPIVHIRAQHLNDDQLRDLLHRNRDDAVRWIRAAAEAGMAPAQIVWGQLLLNGNGIGRAPKAAFAWFERAAASGDPDGRNMVGRCYEQGWGVEPDSQLAMESFALAAKAGHVWAQVNLAQMLMRGGNPADRPRSFVLFRAAAEGGTSRANVKAMNSLARFLEEGWVGPADRKSAMCWYARAASLGDHWAQYNLAMILHGQGVIAEADLWLQRAVAGSDNGFRRRIAPLLLARSEPALRRNGIEALKRIADAGNPEDVSAYATALYRETAHFPGIDQARRPFETSAAKRQPDSTMRAHAPISGRLVRYLAAKFEIISRRLTRRAGSTSLFSKEAL